MEPVEISGFENVTEEFDLNKDEVEQMIDYVVKSVTVRFAEVWETHAGRELNSTRDQYIRNLYLGDAGRMEGVVGLTGELPMMLEEGAGQFDMKSTHLQPENNVKRSEDGDLYMHIPFRMATPEALGESEVFSGIMPKEVHDIAKSKEVGESGSSDPIKPNELPDKFKPQKKQVKIPKSNTYKEYQHKTSIYAGVRKEKDKETGQNRYTSFRTISENSDESAWIHPGFEARRIMEKAFGDFESEIDEVIDQHTDDILSELGYS